MVVTGGIPQPVDGTSCASPSAAGLFALLNDIRFAAGKSSLGFLNPLIYQNQNSFNDITQGNNPGCNTNGFYASQFMDGQRNSNWTPLNNHCPSKNIILSIIIYFDFRLSHNLMNRNG